MPSCNDDSVLKHLVYSYDRKGPNDVVTLLFEFRKNSDSPFAFALPITGDLAEKVSFVSKDKAEKTYTSIMRPSKIFREHVRTRVRDMGKDSEDSMFYGVTCGYGADGLPIKQSSTTNTDPTEFYDISDVKGLEILSVNKGNIGRFSGAKVNLGSSQVYQRKPEPLRVFAPDGRNPSEEEMAAAYKINVKYLQVLIPNVRKGVCGFSYMVTQSLDKPCCFQVFCRGGDGNRCETTVRTHGNAENVMYDGFREYIVEERNFTETVEKSDLMEVSVNGYVSEDNRKIVIGSNDLETPYKTVFVFGGDWDDFVRIDI